MATNVNRRSFIQSTIAGMGASMLPTALLTNSAFATTGNMNPASWAGATDPTLYQKVWDIRFSNTLPWALDPTNAVLAKALNVDAAGNVPVLGVTLKPNLPAVGFVYHADAGTSNTFSVKAGQTPWPMLGPLGGHFADGSPIPVTTLWGYGNHELESIFTNGGGLGVTFPGRSFVVQRGSTVNVNWYNNLVDASGNALPHLVGVDQTISMQSDANGNAINGVPIAVHHHGGANQAEFDGGPDQWFTPLRKQVGPGINAPGKAVNAVGDHLTYQYVNTQEASMHWYHDHGEGVTRINAYAGLAGLFVIRDANEAALIKAGLMPTGPYELPVVIQDKVFQADGSIAYTGDAPELNGWNTSPVNSVPGYSYDPAAVAAGTAVPGPGDQPTHVPEMFGDVICVNGVAWPNLQVEPRQYRLRLLNGSDSRVYNLNFGSLPIWQISTDVGLLNIPVPMNTITIFPGERKDIIIDFANSVGHKLVVTNDAAAPFPTGAVPASTDGVATIMQFDVSKVLDTSVYKKTRMTPQTLLRGWDKATPQLPIVYVAPTALTRQQIMLGEGCDDYGRIMPLLGTVADGTHVFHDPSDITVPLGTTQVWEFWNSTVDSHPIHMHLVQFRILNRQNFTGAIEEKTMSNGWFGVKFTAPPKLSRSLPTPAPLAEQGWKDTVVCPPQQVTRVLVSFDKPGKYVYHCHILGHEEHDMMRWFTVA